MEKKGIGRILALVLITALVIGLVPTAFAALAPSGVKVVYDLTVVEPTTAHLRTYSETDNLWCGAGYPQSNFRMASNNTSGLQVHIAENAWWAIKVMVPEAGKYNLKMNKSNNPNGGKTKVYFGTSASGTDAILAGTEVGIVDFTNYETMENTTSALELVTVGTVNVPTAGEYTIVFYVSERGNTGTRQYFNQVILDGTDVVVVPEEEEEIKVVYNMNTEKVAGGGWIDVVEFGDTNGFWAYETAYKAFSSSAYVQENANGFGAEAAYGLNAWWAMKVYIPKSGSYTLKLNHICYASGGTTNVYFGTPEEGATAIVAKTPVGEVCFYSATQTAAADETVGTIDVPAAGEYILVFKTVKAGDGNGNGTKGRQIFKQVILERGEGSVPMLDISASADKITVGETATVSATSALMSDGATTSDASIIYSVNESDVAVASVDEEGVVTGLSEGTAEIIATAVGVNSEASRSVFITVEKAEPGVEVEDTTVSVAVMPENSEYGSVTGLESVVGEVEIGSNITVTANANDGYKFAYWKNSSGKVLSQKETETFTVNTNTAVTAVFDKISDGTENEFPVELYNANGMLFFENRNTAANSLFYNVISGAGTPSLTGYDFSHWSNTDDGKKISEDYVIGGTTRAVAVYENSDDSYTVKVGGSVVAENKKYGESVTVSSDSADFSCWKLGDKVISYDKSFTFFVWGNVDLTEVKEGSTEALPVAVLSKAGESCHLTYGVPAGFTKIEAGIIFGSGSGITVGSTDGYKVAETLGTGQLTVSSDYEYARGYIIFKTPTNEIRVIYAD